MVPMDEDVARRIEAWVADACAALGVPAPEDVSALLDVAKDAAHNVARPAAPVTTYLLGYAVAQGADAAATAALLSTRAQGFDG